MTFRKSLLGSLVSTALVSLTAANALAQEIEIDRSGLKAISSATLPNKSASQTATYIVQLKGMSGVAQAQELGELKPSNHLAANKGNLYNAKSSKLVAYTQQLKNKQQAVAQAIGATDVLYNYTHTFNGFAARLSQSQAEQLRQHPDVAGVWVDEKQQLTTANTPAFLGLTGANGQHTLGIKGEDVIVGVVDSGIWPENPSFADDGSYSSTENLGWNGVCDSGAEMAEGTFECNNKLIGARYFKAGFESSYEIQYGLGEFESPRDASSHGTHTASTAAGNENVPATLFGTDVGNVTGIAPRARIAAYKVCWNSDYVSPEGVEERGCFGSDSMAAIDAAVADGVDVINYSISGSRTSLTPPQTAAMLRATNAGVFVSVSAGNSGTAPVTVGTPAPWVTSVAASTYDGISYVNAIEIVSRDPAETLLSTEGSITKPLSESGEVTAKVVIAEPLLGCFNGEPSALDNAAEIADNIALLKRGTCNFSEKVERAQLAGAKAVIVYSDTRPVTVMGGTGAYDIPGVMINGTDGEALNAAITAGENVTIKMSAGSFQQQVEAGNIMADFSSRGPNGNTEDLIKPDITAPGVRILAGISSAPMFGPQGETYGYLSGTSMAAPHIAGMAALLKGQNPSWSPAQIKSALMTTARQDVVVMHDENENVISPIPATPFNFGSGHAAPVNAMEPGLTYDLNAGDYFGFMCGQAQNSFVQTESGRTCSEWESDGFATEANQLNYPSMAISALSGSKTLSRTVKDVSGLGGTYVANIEAPAGIDVSVQTFDSNGVETETQDLVVPADGQASYAVTFSKNGEAVIGEWAFGAITWTDENGHSVRSPLAVKAASDVKMDIPEALSLQLNRGRASFPVQMLYSGSTSLDYAGLVAPFGSSRTVSQDEDREFAFNEVGLGFHGFLIPEGTKVVRFSLRDSLVSAQDTDLDMYVYRCIARSCSPVGSSALGGSNEDVILTNPEPAANAPAGDYYIVFVHGWDLAGNQSVDYTMPVWVADQQESTTSIRSTPRAIEGRFNNVTITTRGLEPGFLYMGAVTFFDDEGVAQGTTVLEVQP
ncbi:S8 family serine peptidase [Bowmanella sp. Y26]|uniref:S8 family serine peptidase n=1 Tax=Bowmanella yangjiangensis TaxID=2811230 RepID=UPI001BDC6E89|nr:S8 family serine peptidase [Bowmanella yangjiangensis]MBT1065006.1 S8 family serine peptidase [Bowmanella yangjiangensis]